MAYFLFLAQNTGGFRAKWIQLNYPQFLTPRAVIANVTSILSSLSVYKYSCNQHFLIVIHSKSYAISKPIIWPKCNRLSILDITGTTGTSGIEGINVLYDIYRNEQLAFDPFALFLAAKNNQDTFAGDIFGIGSALDSGDSFLALLSSYKL